MYEKIEWKSFGFKRTCNKNNQLWKKEMISLTNLEKKIHCEQKVCYIRKKEFSTDDDKNYQKVRGHCHYTGKYRGAINNICNLRYKTPKKFM